jgi:hypothetical protein
MLEWANFAKFNIWHWAEEANNSIELWKSTKWMGSALWSIRCLFRCRHHITSSYKYEITDLK